MLHTTNYGNTFIEVAEDCRAERGMEPPIRDGKKSVARMQYELLAEHPYRFTSDELLLELHMQRNGIAKEQRDAERERLFSKGQPCMRSSDLVKKYGWGIHFDGDCKMAIYSVDSEAYAAYKGNPELAHKRAMRT